MSAAKLIEVARELSGAVAPLRFGPPVTHVYNPLDYAWKPHRQYLQKYGAGPKQAVLVGMNPGPWGMAQTGVPFGQVAHVRDWMGISAPVDSPFPEHPKRPVQGFECARSEVSGARLWGWAAHRFGAAERFFERFFVLNFCPLVFMEASGRNRTPDKLPAAEQAELVAACSRALEASLAALCPEWAIGVGAYAEARLRATSLPKGTEVGRILHPSPASPLANKDWAGTATTQLRRLGIDVPGD